MPAAKPRNDVVSDDTRATIDWLREYGLDVVDSDDRGPVHLAFHRLSQQTLLSDPVCLGIQGALCRLDGQVDRAIRLLQRAITRDPILPKWEVSLRTYLSAIHFTRREFAKSQSALEPALALAPDDLEARAVQAALRAHFRDQRVWDDIAWLTDRCDADAITDISRLRCYIRITVAARLGGKLSLAEQYGLLAFDLASQAKPALHRFVAMAAMPLASIYHSDMCDPALALHYADVGLAAAVEANDSTVIALCASTRYSIAAEIGDLSLLEQLHKTMSDLRGPEKGGERAGILGAEAMFFGLTTSWTAMLQYLRTSTTEQVYDSQRPVLQALRAVAAYGSGDEEEALRLAYAAISAGRPRIREGSWDTRLRLISRLLGAAVLWTADRRTEAARALSAYRDQMLPSIRAFADAIPTEDFSTLKDSAADIYGYVRLVARLVSDNAARKQQAASPLTEREREILLACATGATASAIAQDLKIDKATVDWHRSNICRKLGVKRVVTAVLRAQALGLIPANTGA